MTVVLIIAIVYGLSRTAAMKSSRLVVDRIPIRCLYDLHRRAVKNSRNENLRLTEGIPMK
jgi:hypothetical protein